MIPPLLRRLALALLLALALVAGASADPFPTDRVVAWGWNHAGQCDVPEGLTAAQVAAGYGHSLAICANGTVVAWGWNDEGQTNVPEGLIATQIAAGEDRKSVV